MCSSTSVCAVRVSHITIWFSSLTLCAPVSATGPVSRSARITPPKSMYPPHLYKQQGVVLIVLHAIFPFALAIFQHSLVYLFTMMRSNQRHSAPASHWVVHKYICIYIWSGLHVLYLDLTFFASTDTLTLNRRKHLSLQTSSLRLCHQREITEISPMYIVYKYISKHDP